MLLGETAGVSQVKRLILIFLLLSATVQGGQFIVGDSVQFSTFLYRYAPHMAMTSGGDVAWIYCVDKTADSMRVVYTSDMGGTLGGSTISNSGGTSSPYCGLYSFGDSMYALTGRSAASNNFWLSKFSGDPFGLTIFDTITYTGYSGAGGTPVFTMSLSNDSIIVVHCEETGTPDSMFGIISNGALGQTTTWARLDSADLTKPPGLKIPFRETVPGILWHAYQESTLYWIDRTAGFDTIDTYIAPLGGATGNASGTTNIVQVDGDTALIAYQKTVAAGTDALWSKRFRISGVGAGSGTTVDLDSALIEAHTSIPTGFHYFPTYSVVGVNGDTVLLYYRYWADTLNVDSMDIAYKMSTDGGATWGSRTIYVAAVNASKRWMLEAPSKIYLRGSYLLRGVMWTDSVTTRDTMRAFLDSVAVTPPAPAWISGVHHSKAGIMTAHSKSYIGTMHRK